MSPRELSPDEVKQLQNLQALFDPATCFQRINDFAKWIFATIAVVGTLGAGLSNSTFSTLSPSGKVIFAIAVVLVGASLFAAVQAMEPQWVHANLSSRESMLAAVDANLLKRRRPLKWASYLFASALVMAALAPLASLVRPAAPTTLVALGYEVTSEGKMTAQATASNLLPSSAVEFTITSGTTPAGMVAPIVRKVADDKGRASLSIEVDDPSKWGTNLQLVVRWTNSLISDAPWSGHQELALPPTAIEKKPAVQQTHNHDSGTEKPNAKKKEPHKEE